MNPAAGCNSEEQHQRGAVSAPSWRKKCCRGRCLHITYVGISFPSPRSISSLIMSLCTLSFGSVFQFHFWKIPKHTERQLSLKSFFNFRKMSSTRLITNKDCLLPSVSGDNRQWERQEELWCVWAPERGQGCPWLAFLLLDALNIGRFYQNAPNPNFMWKQILKGFPGGSGVNNLPANARDMESFSGSGRFPGGRNGNPLQYSLLENPMGRGAWWTTVHVTKRNQTWLRDWATDF